MKTLLELEQMISNERMRITILKNQIDYLIKEVKELKKQQENK